MLGYATLRRDFPVRAGQVRPWQAAVFCIVWSLHPFLPQRWRTINRLKFYRGSHHQIQPPSLHEYNIYKMSEIKRLRRLSWALTATRAQSPLNINQNWVMWARCMHKVTCVAVCKERLDALSSSPVNLPQRLTEEKRDVSGLKAETHANNIVNARLHSVKNANPLWATGRLLLKIMSPNSYK